jgi:hypothetical protein
LSLFQAESKAFHNSIGPPSETAVQLRRWASIHKAQRGLSGLNASCQ